MFYFLMILFLISIFIGAYFITILTFNKLYYIIDILIITIIFVMRYIDIGLPDFFIGITGILVEIMEAGYITGY